MGQIQWTMYTRVVFFFSILLFLEGYLFNNLAAPLVGSFLLIFLFFCKIRFKTCVESIQMNRSILEHILYVDKPFHVKTSIIHTGRKAIISVKECIPETATLLHGENTIRKTMNRGEEVTLSYQVEFHSRGTHRLQNTEIDITDLCHLFTTHLSINKETLLHIHSNPNELKKAKTAYTQEDVLAIPSLVGSEITREFEGIRAYLPGDLIRDIDWKASSRLQTLLTKTFQKKELLETWILLDCTRSMRKASGEHAKLEHAMVVGMQLTHLLQSMHHQVGFIAYDEHKIISHIASSFDYQRIYRELTELPTIILTEAYTPRFQQDELKKNPEINEEELFNQQQFLSLIGPFITGKKYQMKHPLQTTGIYQAINTITSKSKQKHIVILTDLETNRDAYFEALQLAHAKHNNIWLLNFATPHYYKNQNITIDTIEQLYTFEISQEQLIKKLKQKNIEIIDVKPQIQAPHIMAELRRKTS